MWLRTLFVALLVLISGVVGPVLADEVIESFHSAVDLPKTGTMTVTETIRVRAEGYEIKRGIFRDFPLTFTAEDGSRRRVDFSVVSIERNGRDEPYTTSSIDGGIRLQIGDPEVFLPRGQHTYSITYTTRRQVRYRADFDELFWNVTGNGWSFPIDEASATIVLPEGVSPEATTFFTGPQGATDRNARVLVEDNEVFFATTRPLAKREGLTVGVKLAKGVIDPPSESDEFWWGLGDRMNSIIASIAFAVVLLYFAANWVRVGRDPSKGLIIPRWDAPMGLSPALVNYVANRGFSNSGWTAFSASAINLAVKGLIVLDDVKDKVSFKRTQQAPDKALPLGEDVIYSTVKAVGLLPVDKPNGPRFQAMGEAFRDSIDKEHRDKYYRYNRGVITGGIILTIVAYLVIVLFGTFDEDMLGALVLPAFIFVFVAVFSAMLAAAIRSASNSVVRVVAWILLGIFWLVMALVLLVSAFALFDFTQTVDDQVALACCGGILITSIFFTTIMGAATPLGRQLMDGVEGLKLYLTVAEKDRMNLAGAPQMSPQHFEKLLPYAVALGIEKQWSEHFQQWLDTAGATATQAYQPGWYAGSNFEPHQFGSRIGAVSSTISTSIASSLPPPPSSSSSGFSSSSGGGGGSSGGGGGGGGGGGW